MTPETKARILEVHGPGEVRMYDCPVCGHLEWASTDRSKPPLVVLEPLQDCPKCRTAYLRAPEVVEWVLGVVETAKRSRI